MPVGHIFEKQKSFPDLGRQARKNVGLEVHLEKAGGPVSAHVKGVDHVWEDDEQFSSADRYDLPVDDDVAGPLLHHAQLHILVAMGAKKVARLKGARKRIVNQILV